MITSGAAAIITSYYDVLAGNNIMVESISAVIIIAIGYIYYRIFKHYVTENYYGRVTFIN